MQRYVNFSFISLVILIYLKKTITAMPIEQNSPQSGPTPQPFRVITVAVPDFELGQKLARGLVIEGLAATVNIFPSSSTIYIWDGKLSEKAESVLFIYTHVSQYDLIEKYIRNNHVYIEPGVVQLPIIGGSASFLQWLQNQSTGKTMKGLSS